MIFRQAFAPFLEAYQHHGPLPADELAAVNDIRTSLTDTAENQQGLDDARFTWEQMAK
jgi:hypothetical protein